MGIPASRLGGKAEGTRNGRYLVFTGLPTSIWKSGLWTGLGRVDSSHGNRISRRWEMFVVFVGLSAILLCIENDISLKYLTLSAGMAITRR